MNKKMIWLKQHLLVVSLALSIMVVLIIVGLIFLTPHNNAIMIVNVAPIDAEVSVGQGVYRNGTFENMVPGHYIVTISKEGFDSKTVEFDFENDKIVYINEYLVQPNLDFDYYETDKDSLLVLREYSMLHEGDVGLESFLKEYDRKKTIEDVLPLEYEDETTGGFYNVSFIEGNSVCKKSYCLTINASDDIYKELAFTVLKNHGFTPEDYEIVDISDSCD